MKRPKRMHAWRIVKGNPAVQVAEVVAATARAALSAYASEHDYEGKPQGHAALAVTGVGLLRAEKIERPVPRYLLPPVEEMRAALLARGGDQLEANLISPLAVELRYRANFLGERMIGPGGALENAERYLICSKCGLVGEVFNGWAFTGDDCTTPGVPGMMHAWTLRDRSESAQPALSDRPHTAAGRKEESMSEAVAEPTVKDLAKALAVELKAIDGVKVKKAKSYERYSVNGRTLVVAKVGKRGLNVEVRPEAKPQPKTVFKPTAEDHFAEIVEATRAAAAVAVAA